MAKPREVSGRVAENVRVLRERRNWSLREVSERTAATGHRILLTGLSKLERGDRLVTVDDLNTLAQVFGVSMSLLTADTTSLHAEADAIGVHLIEALGDIDHEHERLNKREAQAFAEARRALADDEALTAAFRDIFAEMSEDAPEMVNRIMVGVGLDQRTTKRKSK